MRKKAISMILAAALGSALLAGCSSAPKETTAAATTAETTAEEKKEESKAEETAAAHGIKALSKLPIDPKLAAAVDGGMIELFEQPGIDPVADAVDALLD